MWTRVIPKRLKPQLDGDRAIRIPLASQAQAWAAKGLLQAEGLPADIPAFELILGDSSILVLFRTPFSGVAQAQTVCQWLSSKLSGLEEKPQFPGRLHRISVDYGPSFGADFSALCGQLGLTPDALVELHSSTVFTVGFLGFLPGFAYLTGTPGPLCLPRLARPRARVPAGSVAVAGGYCAIYPWESPGGWHLLGQTSQPLFSPELGSLLQAGDQVQFIPKGKPC